MLVLVVLMILPADLHPQPVAEQEIRLADKYYSLQLAYQCGKVFGTNAFLRGINAAGVPVDRYQVLSVRLACQTTGTKVWEQLYRYPRYGIGMLLADFRSKELGRPVSVFGFLAGPVFRIRHFSLTYDFAMGVSFPWNPYDPLTNPYNVATSTTVNSMIEAGIAAEARLLPRINAGIEFGFNHFSNGAVALPNKGVNCAFLKYSLRYDLYSRDPVKTTNPVKKIKPFNEWIIAFYTGFNRSAVPVRTNAVQKLDREPVFAFGIFGIYNRQLNHKSKIGAGIEFGYIGLVNPQYRNYAHGLEVNRKPDIRRLELSIFPSYELAFNHFSIFAQAGFYLYRDELIRLSPVFYQRAGFKYHFMDHYFAALQVRAYKFMIALFTECTLGYRF